MKVVRKPPYRMATTTMNLMKSFVIALRQGISVPKYGWSERREHILKRRSAGKTSRSDAKTYLGTMNNASNDKISKAISIILSLSLNKPTTPEDWSICVLEVL